MNAPATVELFRCIPINGVMLQRSACAKRYEKARQPAGIAAREPKLVAPDCVTCELGAAHSRGEAPLVWPSHAKAQVIAGTPIEIVTRIPPRAADAFVPPKREYSKEYSAPKIAHPVATRAESAAKSAPTVKEYSGRDLERTERIEAALEEVDRELDDKTDERDLERHYVAREAVERELACTTKAAGRPPRMYRVGDRELTAAQWAAEPDVPQGLKAVNIGSRVRRGWPIEQAIFTPASAAEQSESEAPLPRTRRNARRYRVGDREMPLALWLREADVPRDLTARIVIKRIARGWPTEAAIFTPRDARQPSTRAPRASRPSARRVAPPNDQPESRRETVAGASFGSEAVARAPNGPAELLRAAGYVVHGAMRCPGGLVLVVEVSDV
jgi:hypothetical protein